MHDIASDGTFKFQLQVDYLNVMQGVLSRTRATLHCIAFLTALRDHIWACQAFRNGILEVEGFNKCQSKMLTERCNVFSPVSQFSHRRVMIQSSPSRHNLTQIFFFFFFWGAGGGITGGFLTAIQEKTKVSRGLLKLKQQLAKFYEQSNNGN